MIINMIGSLKRLDNVFLKKIWLVPNKRWKQCREKMIIQKEMEKHLLKRGRRIEQILVLRSSMEDHSDKILLDMQQHRRGKHQLQKEDLQEVVLDKHHQLTEEIHKEVGQKVNYLLRCRNKQQIKTKHLMHNMVWELKWGKDHKAIGGSKQVELSVLLQVLNNITRFLNQKLQQQTQEIDSEYLKNLIYIKKHIGNAK